MFAYANSAIFHVSFDSSRRSFFSICSTHHFGRTIYDIYVFYNIPTYLFSHHKPTLRLAKKHGGEGTTPALILYISIKAKQPRTTATMPRKKKSFHNAKKTSTTDLEFDTSKVDEDAPSPIPSPVLGPISDDGRKQFNDEDGDGVDDELRSDGDGNINNRDNNDLGRPPLPPPLSLDTVGEVVVSTSRSSQGGVGGLPSLTSSGLGGDGGGEGNLPAALPSQATASTSASRAAAHHRIVSSSEFSAMQLVRMRELLYPYESSFSGGLGYGAGEEPVTTTIDENTPLMIPAPPPPPPTRVSFTEGNNKVRTESDLTDVLRDLGLDDDDGDGSNDNDNSNSSNDDDDNDDTRTFLGSIFTKGNSILEGTESIIEGAKTIIADIKDEAKEAWADYDDKRHYDWRDDWKDGILVCGGGSNTTSGNSGNNVGNGNSCSASCIGSWYRFKTPLKFLRWIITGVADTSTSKQRDDEIQDNLNGLARLLSLLRDYYDKYGLPTKGGFKDQEYVLKECVRDLYLGGAPIWTLQPVMNKVAEGLTGQRGIHFFLLPRRAFMFTPSPSTSTTTTSSNNTYTNYSTSTTSMFELTRGYDMQRLDAMESVAVRLASFASNTSGSRSVPSRWPKPQELRRAFRTESVAGTSYKPSTKDEMAEEILSLASESEGLFYFINTHRSAKAASLREQQQSSSLLRDDIETGGTGTGTGASIMGQSNKSTTELGEFWTVEDNIRELFRRLATIEAAESIDKCDTERKRLYSPTTIMLFRMGSSAGACAFWFNGSWADICISGALAVLVAKIGTSPLLNKQERIVFEVVASFVVGVVSGLISLTWPEYTCFGAMAISGILDLLQGFRVVYSIIEIMSRHCVTGAADFLEGVFFTALIAYFLRVGQYVSVEIMGQSTTEDDTHHYLQCSHPVNEWWYLLLVPMAAISWSGLFNPHYVDLPFMAGHGILGYIVSWQFYKASATNNNLNNFLAAMAVTFSAGLISRFTGRQALGNTVAGLYVLLPGAYLVTTAYSANLEGFLTSIILRAVTIGIGAWTGTILCSPTMIGVNRGLVNHNSGMPSLVEGSSDSVSSYPSSSSLNSSTGSGVGAHFRRRRDRRQGQGNNTSLLLF